MKRKLLKAFRRRPWWQRLLVVAAVPVVCLNLAVAFFGNSLVFPLSPFFLKEKAQALGLYGLHRVRCFIGGHGDMGPLIARAEKRNGLPAGLLAAVVEVESKTQPHRISGAGAMGPAQLMPSTAALLGVGDPFDPAVALDASARYLAQHLKQFKRVDLAVAAYNAGPGNVDGRVPRNGETEYYVARVLAELAKRQPRTERKPRRTTVASRAGAVVPAVQK